MWQFWIWSYLKKNCVSKCKWVGQTKTYETDSIIWEVFAKLSADTCTWIFATHSLLSLVLAQNDNWSFGAENIWSFRNDNENNVKVKAVYTGRAFKENIGDFTICYRFRILYFNPSNNGINLLLAKHGKEKFHFRAFPYPTPNKLEIKVIRDK